jgi:restriction system protein
VGVEIVRQLYGVVEAEKATAGVIVTTSSFTRGAKSFALQHSHRMTLHDYGGIRALLGPPT